MSGTLSKVDKAVATVGFILKKKKRRVDDMSRKVDVSENQKIFIGEELDFIRNVEVLLDQCKQNVNIQLGKLPPQALDLEEVVLGALMLESGGHAVIKILETKHFYLPEHRDIFSSIKRLWNADRPVDMRTVVDDLKKYSLLEKGKGATYIAELTSKVSSVANLNYHAHILIERAIKRQLIVIGGKIMQDGYEETVDALELLDLANTEMKEINSWVK